MLLFRTIGSVFGPITGYIHPPRGSLLAGVVHEKEMVQGHLQDRCLNAIELSPRLTSRHATGPHLRPHLLCRWESHHSILFTLRSFAIANRTVVSRARWSG